MFDSHNVPLSDFRDKITDIRFIRCRFGLGVRRLLTDLEVTTNVPER